MTVVSGKMGMQASLTLLGMALILAGCNDAVFDTGMTYSYIKGELFGAEVTAPVAEAATPPLIRRMSGRSDDWPHLSTVPMRPPEPATPAERESAMARLTNDRSANRLADEALREVAPPPLPVPLPVPQLPAGLLTVSNGIRPPN